jgi:choice-of-anchor C domain-containing protein
MMTRLTWGNLAHVAAHGFVVSVAVLAVVLGGCGESLADLQQDLGQITQALSYEGFEYGPSTPSSGYITLAAGNTSLPGWTISGGGIDYITTFWVSAEGSRSLDLNGESAGAISARYYTYPGYPVQVSFSMAGNPGCGGGVRKLRIEANGQWQDYVFDTTGRSRSNMGWTKQYFTYTPSSDITVVTFRSLNGGICGPAVDYVFGGTSMVY